MSTLIDAALEWASKGVAVFPCNLDKRPKTKDGFYNASTSPADVVAMFTSAGDNTLIGARMGKASGLFALDFDTYKPGEAGASAKAYLKALEDSGLLPDTQEHATTSGGLHVIYKSTTDWPNLNPCKGVEVKGEGGYIILPPSAGYKITHAGFSEAPRALVEHLVRYKREAAGSSIDDLKRSVLAGEDFHEPLTAIAAKRSAAGWTLERVMNELITLMQASIAQVSTHERHSRWLKLMHDSGRELSRIATSANGKYNTSATVERAKEKLTPEFIAKAKAASETVFASPPEGNKEPEKAKAVDDYDDDEWPFEGEGYFAHEKRDVVNQTFVMYPLFAERESILMAAEPKAGKTAVALKLALCVALGESLGNSFGITEARPVLYFALEGTRAIELRLEAEKQFRATQGLTTPDNIPLFIVEKSKNFIVDAAQDAVCNQIIAADRYARNKHGRSIGLLVIDTLTKAMPGKDQNSVEDTSKLFELIGKLRDGGFVGAILFIHHLGKTGVVRGSTNIEAEVDVVVSLSKKRNSDSVELYVSRARSIDDGGSYFFKLNNFELGQNSQGHRIAAPVVTLEEEVTNKEAENAKHSMVLAKILHLITSLGAGRHAAADLLEGLVALGHITALAAKRKGGVLSSAAQEFLNETLAGQLSYVYKEFVIEVQKSGTQNVAAFVVRKVASPT